MSVMSNVIFMLLFVLEFSSKKILFAPLLFAENRCYSRKTFTSEYFRLKLSYTDKLKLNLQIWNDFRRKIILKREILMKNGRRSKVLTQNFFVIFSGFFGIFRSSSRSPGFWDFQDFALGIFSRFFDVFISRSPGFRGIRDFSLRIFRDFQDLSI